MSIDVSMHGRVAVVTVNRPEVLNALSTELLAELLAAFRGLADDDECGVAVLTGAGDRAFIAGRGHRRAGHEDAAHGAHATPSTGRTSRTCSRRCASRRSQRSTATRSAAAARWRWPATCASRRRPARFGQPEINLGIIPGWGGTQRLARTTTLGFAKELVLTGRMVERRRGARARPRERGVRARGAARAHARDRAGDRREEPDRARLREGGDKSLAPRRPRREPRARGRPLRDPVLDRRRARGPDGLHREAPARFVGS